MLPERFYDDVQRAENEPAQYADSAYSLESGENGRIISGREAVRQAVVKALATERFEYPVYSGRYGLQTRDLVGADSRYVCAELERRIEETLTADERITAVTDFAFSKRKGRLFADFTAHTVYGDVGFAGVSTVSVG